MLEHCRDYNPKEIRQYALEHFSFASAGGVLDEVYEFACNFW